MNYIIVDLEATCWNDDQLREKYQSEIIEIGAVKVNDKLEIVDTFQVFIKPKLNLVLSDFCKELTSITQEEVTNGMSFSEAIIRFLSWIGDEPYCLCSWGFYDKKQFKLDCELHNLSTNWLKHHISVKHQFCANRKIKRVGMPTALKMLEIPLEGTHHRGIDDAKNIAKIFIRVFSELKF